MGEQALDEKLLSIGWTVTESGCWEWKGTRNPAGYGVFRARAFGFDQAPAHRVMYEHHVGPIPDGLMVRHRCDNPPCVNPEHLLPGTAADNSRDRIERGRPGGRPRNAARDAEMLRLREEEGLTDAQIAARLKVARTTVTRSLGPGRPQGRPPANADEAAIAAARADGASWREVQQRTGTSKSTAHRRQADRKPDNSNL